jgi:hypothetical protein
MAYAPLFGCSFAYRVAWVVCVAIWKELARGRPSQGMGPTSQGKREEPIQTLDFSTWDLGLNAQPNFLPEFIKIQSLIVESVGAKTPC